LAPFSPAPTSFDTTLVFITLHLELMVISYFSSKTMSQNKTLRFFLILSSWHSNACCVYRQVVFLGWFVNTFGIFFTLKIQ
jgi:hypothetical protein